MDKEKKQIDTENGKLTMPDVINLVCPKCGNTGRCEPRTLSDPDGRDCDVCG